jgi:secondary thiamine-phosphate synthase enzyme
MGERRVRIAQARGSSPLTSTMAGDLLEIPVRTPEREILVDVTQRVQTALSQSFPAFTGLVCVFVPHTTAGVTINEGADHTVIRDIVDGLRRLVPRDAGYRHAEGNSDAHIKSSLMGSSVLIPVDEGRLCLGTWQSIYLAEFDGPRNRKIWVTPVAGPPRGERA